MFCLFNGELPFSCLKRTTLPSIIGTNRPLLHQFTSNTSFQWVGPHILLVSGQLGKREREKCSMKNKRWIRQKGGKCEINWGTRQPPYSKSPIHWYPILLLNGSSVNAFVYFCMLIFTRERHKGGRINITILLRSSKCFSCSFHPLSTVIWPSNQLSVTTFHEKVCCYILQRHFMMALTNKIDRKNWEGGY